MPLFHFDPFTESGLTAEDADVEQDRLQSILNERPPRAHHYDEFALDDSDEVAAILHEWLGPVR